MVAINMHSFHKGFQLISTEVYRLHVYKLDADTSCTEYISTGHMRVGDIAGTRRMRQYEALNAGRHEHNGSIESRVELS